MHAFAAFNIPRLTIYLHLTNPEKKIGPGRHTNMSVQNEEIVARTTKTIPMLCVELTKQQFLKSVADCVNANKIKI